MISVVIRSKDEADRLRLTIGSFIKQLNGHELIVVNDGSIDHTDSVLSEAVNWGNISVIKNKNAIGRSAASNAGAAIAKGDTLLFMDGDVLASPNLLLLHEAYHLKHPNSIARGENRHLRCTRSLLNPESGTPFSGPSESTLIRPVSELNLLRVTLDQIQNDFASVDKRSGPSIYMGFQPQLLFNLEVGAILQHPNSSILWAAASGHNSSISRSKFEAVNGFDSQININEQRELAFKLSKIGVKAGYIAGARSYHMIHQSGWRNPLVMPDWEKRFLYLHPYRAVALLNIFWATIANPNQLPPIFRIQNLLELEAASLNTRKLNFDEARKLLVLDPLGSDFWLKN